MSVEEIRDLIVRYVDYFKHVKIDTYTAPNDAITVQNTPYMITLKKYVRPNVVQLDMFTSSTPYFADPNGDIAGDQTVNLFFDFWQGLRKIPMATMHPDHVALNNPMFPFIETFNGTNEDMVDTRLRFLNFSLERAGVRVPVRGYVLDSDYVRLRVDTSPDFFSVNEEDPLVVNASMYIERNPTVHPETMEVLRVDDLEVVDDTMIGSNLTIMTISPNSFIVVMRITPVLKRYLLEAYTAVFGFEQRELVSFERAGGLVPVQFCEQYAEQVNRYLSILYNYQKLEDLDVHRFFRFERQDNNVANFIFQRSPGARIQILDASVDIPYPMLTLQQRIAKDMIVKVKILEAIPLMQRTEEQLEELVDLLYNIKMALKPRNLACNICGKQAYYSYTAAHAYCKPCSTRIK